MMLQHLRGWISLPILLTVAMFAWLLTAQHVQLNDASRWRVRIEQNDAHVFWQAVYEHLSSRSNTAVALSECEGFCAPSAGGWSPSRILEQDVYVQRYRSDAYKVTRLCASKDLHEIHCWWLRQGQSAMATLRQ